MIASTRLALFTLAALAPALISPAHAAADAPAFEVTYTPEVAAGPISARVYVMLGQPGARGEPRTGPSWFNPQPFFALDATGWKPGEPLTVGADAVGFPGPLDTLEPGTYIAQAVVRLNPDTHGLGTGPGNAYGPVARVEIGPVQDGPMALIVDQIVTERPFVESDRVKRVDIPSPLLSEFHGRPIRMRATVVLPEAATGDDSGDRRFPAVYVVPGFGGDDRSSAQSMQRTGLSRDFLVVGLDPDCGTGHHVFADSANNGPRGQALVEELIPYIEDHYPAIAEPGARLLTGHSSGGWSTLWLQVAYPEFFGGVWSTSPDPIDFRDFQQIDLYALDANMFRDPEGNRRPLARRGTQPVVWYEDFSRMEDVVGDGGQLHSFEAVFSPRGSDGKPAPLWNRETGAVDPEVAQTWKAYDIRLILERDWERLGPLLSGKLNVITGSLDTFYLEGAVELLKESLDGLDSDAVVEIVPGKDHGSILDAALFRRIETEMRAAVAESVSEPAVAGGEEATR